MNSLHDETRAPLLLWKDPGLVVAEIGKVCMVVWRLAVVRERFEAQRVGLEHVVRAYPEGAGFLCVVEATSPIPSYDLQRASANMIAIHRAHLKYVACVIEGDSIKTALVRNVLSHMRMLVTGKIAVGYLSTVAEAGKEMQAHGVPIGSIESFGSSVEEMRALLGPAPRGAR